MGEQGTIRKHERRELVFGPDRPSKFPGRLLNGFSAFLHAAAGIESHDNGNGIDRFLKGIDFLLDAVFEHLEIVRNDIDEPFCICHGEFHRRTDRWRARSKITGSGSDLQPSGDIEGDLPPTYVLLLVRRRFVYYLWNVWHSDDKDATPPTIPAPEGEKKFPPPVWSAMRRSRYSPLSEIPATPPT